MTENLIDIVAHHHQLRSQQFQLITRTMMTPLVKVVSRSVILRGGGRPWLPAAAHCKPGTALQSRFKPHTLHNMMQTKHCTTQSRFKPGTQHNLASNRAQHYTIRTLQTTHTTQSARCARIKVDTTQCRHHRLNCVAQNAQNALQCTHHTLDIAHLDVELHTPESLHGGKSSRLIVHFVKLGEHSVLPAG